MTPQKHIQGDSLGRDSEKIIINQVILHRRKRILGSIFLATCGDICVTEDSEIGLYRPGNTGPTRRCTLENIAITTAGKGQMAEDRQRTDQSVTG
jgi:DsbC/DsbD-like thiol-disulfide interchange protein